VQVLQPLVQEQVLALEQVLVLKPLALALALERALVFRPLELELAQEQQLRHLKIQRLQ
jgi:hypothetical protein